MGFVSTRCYAFCKLPLYVISRKTNEPNMKKWQKKTSFMPDLGPCWPKFGLHMFFFRRFYLYLIYIFQAILILNFKENKLNKLEKMAKNLVLVPILTPLVQICTPKTFFVVSPLPDFKHCCKLWLYAISRKTNEQNLRKRQKT